MMNDKIIKILNWLLSFGTLWTSGKTVTGIAALLLGVLASIIPEGFVLAHLSPELVTALTAILMKIGFTLTPMGVLHKVVKAEIAKQ